MLEHFIILTQVYDKFGIGTQASWYRLVQLRKIDTSSLMWSCFDSNWSSYMSNWFNPSGISLACKLILNESDD